MTDDDLWYAPIDVQAHARPRIRDRAGRDPDDPRVAGEIRLALIEGRWSTVQPRWTRTASRQPQARDAGRLYAWNESFSRCWVLTRISTRLLLVTVLVEISAIRGNAEDRLIRTGSERR